MKMITKVRRILLGIAVVLGLLGVSTMNMLDNAFADSCTNTGPCAVITIYNDGSDGDFAEGHCSNCVCVSDEGNSLDGVCS
jgi:hypothetical protein